MLRYRTTELHDGTEECFNVHCWIHGVDEPAGKKDYIICGECGHVYRTARSLRRAYRRVLLSMMRNKSVHMNWLSNKFSVGKFTHIWMMLTVRASKIYFCQHCIHDF